MWWGDEAQRPPELAKRIGTLAPPAESFTERDRTLAERVGKPAGRKAKLAGPLPPLEPRGSRLLFATPSAPCPGASACRTAAHAIVFGRGSFRLRTGSLPIQKDGLYPWLGKLRDPFGKHRDSVGKLRDRSGKLRDRSGKLRDPSGKLRDRSGKLRDPFGELRDSVGKLRDSVGKLRPPLGELPGPLGELTSACRGASRPAQRASRPAQRASPAAQSASREATLARCRARRGPFCRCVRVRVRLW
jgi:hypothetical protein